MTTPASPLMEAARELVESEAARSAASDRQIRARRIRQADTDTYQQSMLRWADAVNAFERLAGRRPDQILARLLVSGAVTEEAVRAAARGEG